MLLVLNPRCMITDTTHTTVLLLAFFLDSKSITRDFSCASVDERAEFLPTCICAYRIASRSHVAGRSRRSAVTFQGLRRARTILASMTCILHLLGRAVRPLASFAKQRHCDREVNLEPIRMTASGIQVVKSSVEMLTYRLAGYPVVLHRINSS